MKTEVADLYDMSLLPITIKGSRADSSTSASDQEEVALFLITPLPTLVARLSLLVASFVQELEIKVGMAVELTKIRDRTVLTAYLSAWTLQVFVDDDELRSLTDMIDTEKILAVTNT
mmetsp:Transcript_8797/g.13971  ORF Transcript_8797/g.13971 Transcript_8797/m.13971 type:complete len:117 (+) Transcript_8797:115-465(+)